MRGMVERVGSRCPSPLPPLRERASFALSLTTVCVSSVACASAIELAVDATDLPRNLLRSTLKVEAPRAGGEVELLFVIWSPGNHTPSGPIENLIDLAVRDCRGRALRWERDPARMERFTVESPAGCDHLDVSLSYIASQPNFNSRSTDSYGRADLGVLNWNTVLLYPGGRTNQQITVRASLGLPSEWAYATALRAAPESDGRFAALRELDPVRPVNWITFEEVPLAELVDSPVIMGRHLKSYQLEIEGYAGPAHRLNVVAPEARDAEVPDWILRDLASMCRQTMLVFASAEPRPSGSVLHFPRSRYDFLIVADSSMNFAVEHGESTLTALATKAFTDAKKEGVKGGGAGMVVLAHEYFHTWCGKLAAPDGLVRSDFSTPARTELLWVYEGLTSYYDNLLACRAGMITFEEYKQDLTNLAVALEQRSGRLWRSVHDTAVAARFLRQRGLYWYDRRRGQEYYGEGAMFWLEADAIIRRAGGGERSLDDFCRILFDVPVRPVGDQATYTRADVVRILASLEPRTDWDALIRKRIEAPAEALDLSPILALMGWRLDYADEPTPEQKKLIDEGEGVNLRTSLGLRLDKAGEIIDIVPGSPADEAGLAYGMKALAVDGWEYTKDRLKDAVKETPRKGKVEFITSFGGRVETRVVEYAGGMRVPRLVRIDEEPDILSEVVKAR